jgi:hypothetical protein
VAESISQAKDFTDLILAKEATEKSENSIIFNQTQSMVNRKWAIKKWAQ